MRRLLRILFRLLVLLVLVAVGLFVAARVYLRSAGTRQRVVSRLEEIYGGPVELQEAEIGVLGGTSLHGLRLFQADKSDDEPWVNVGTVETDISALDLLRGVTPKKITLRDPSLTLHLNRSGRLLTALPEGAGLPVGQGGTWPDIRVEGGQVTIRQDGRPALVVQGVGLAVRPDGTRMAVTGAVSDSDWGEWSLDGSLDPADGSLTVRLKTDRAAVTQDKLLRLPFVPGAVWHEVEASGTTAVDFTFRHDPNAGSVNHYRVALQPQGASITLPRLSLPLEEVRGGITIEDGLVTLDHVSGRALGGIIETAESTLDFRGKESQYHFVVTARDLEAAKVPRDWDVPDWLRQQGGRLSGHADLHVRSDGTIATGGTGEATVTGVMLGGKATTIKLRLRPTGQGFGLGEPAAEPVKPSKESRRPKAQVVPVAVQRVLAEDAATYLDITFNLNDADLAQLIKDVGVAVPFDVSGRLAVQVQASLPVDRPRDLRAYRASGTVTLPTLTISGVDMKDVSARVRYDDGSLRLEDVRGRVAGAPARRDGGPVANFTGSARLGVVPQGDLIADLKLTEIPLGPIVRRAGLKEEVAGAVSGTIEYRAPSARLRDPASWRGSGKLTAERVAACGWSLTGAGATIRVADGRLSATAVTGTLEGAAVTGSGDVNLTAPYRYAGRLDLARGDLASLQRLTPELRPPVAITGQFGIAAEVTGTLGPFTATVSGSGSGRDVKVETVSLPSVRFRWAAEGSVLRLTQVQIALCGGEVTGSADVPLDASRDCKAALDFAAIEVGALASLLPALPLRLEGKASGSVTGTLKAAPPGGARSLDAEVDLSSPKLRLQDLPMDKLTGRMVYRKDGGEYHLQGGLLGGTFELDGRLPPAVVVAVPPAAGSELPPDSHLHVHGARLGRLGEALTTRGTLDQLHGRFDLDVDYRLPAPDYAPVGSGRFSLTGFHWGDRESGDSIRGTLLLTQGEVRLRDLNGNLGGGTLRGQVVLRPRDPNRSHFNLALDGADASQVLAPWPALAANLTGTLDARLHGTLGRQWQGGGDLVLTRGKIRGLDVVEVRLPLRFDVVPALGRAQFDIGDLSAQVAHGRVTGRVNLGLSGETRLDGNLRFQELDLRTMSGPPTANGQIGAGQISGQIAFNGSNVRSLDDVTATVEASFTRAQTFQLPILSQLVPFLVPGRAGTTVQNGEIRGRLAAGIFRVQRLSLSGSSVDLYADGTLTTAGRLNLDVTATSGVIGAGTGLFRLVGLRLPPNDPMPVTLLLEATRRLASTSVHLRVNGTVHDPAVRVEPLSVLSDEAARFFLLRANAGPN